MTGEQKDIFYGNEVIYQFMCVIQNRQPINNQNFKVYKAPSYHKKWDKLMEVIEIIESISGSEENSSFQIRIEVESCVIQEFNKKRPYYHDIVIRETKREATWQAIINFIQWYNLNILNHE